MGWLHFVVMKCDSSRDSVLITVIGWPHEATQKTNGSHRMDFSADDSPGFVRRCAAQWVFGFVLIAHVIPAFAEDVAVRAVACNYLTLSMDYFLFCWVGCAWP